MNNIVERVAGVVKGTTVLAIDILAIGTELIRQVAIVVDDAIDRLKDALTVKGD